MIPTTRLNFDLKPRTLDDAPNSLYASSTGRWKGRRYTPAGALVRVSKQIQRLMRLVPKGDPHVAKMARNTWESFKRQIRGIRTPNTLERLIQTRECEERAMLALGTLLQWVSDAPESTPLYLRTGGLPPLYFRFDSIEKDLVLRDGSINTARIPEMRRWIRTLKLKFHEPLARALLKLEFDSELVETLERASSIQLCEAGEKIVRASCKLRRALPIEKRHIVQTLLQMLTRPIRQRETGSCFATRFAIQLQAWDPQQVIIDGINLLEKGYLMRYGIPIPCFVELSAKTPLLYAWEYCLASMAEAGPGAIFIAHLIHLIHKEFPVSHSKISDLWLKELRANTRYLYDPDINQGSIASDGRSSLGGWVLHNPQRKWERIDSPPKFIQHLHHCFRSACYKSAHLLSDNEFNRLTGKLIPSITANLNDRKKLRELAEAYGKKYENSPPPWINRNGHFCYTAITTYFERLRAEEWPSYPVRSIPQLLHLLCHWIQDLPADIRTALRKDPMLPTGAVTKGKHGFNLLPGHPTFYPLWTDPRVRRQKVAALQQRAKELSLLPATRMEKLFPAYLLGIPLSRFPEGMSRAALYKKLLRLQRYGRKSVEEMLLLPKELLKEDLIVFADTNWEDGNQPVHLAIGPNPYTGKLALFELRGESLILADEKLWIQDPDWLLPPHQDLNPRRKT